ncbi:S8/S53 family peptidase [Amycolatopsis acidicola]|uniref:S8/S53 family peptidase n=1 Tax=Amycolatopsis acidicola TaxID=2596893 RepID=A0A5N0VFR6_9PSEU|nr:S53 family peptidase [Amycolatopsis acidicola]KAA9163970.1 S8/S53 family peptidase [Amycolatopsis acidicola]
MLSRAWWSTAAAGLAVAAGFAVPPAAAQTDLDSGGRAVVDGSVPGWATTQARTGSVDENSVRQVQVALPLRDQAGAAKLAAAVSTPGSAQQGQFLTQQQFLDRFGPTEDTVKTVQDWLSQQGITVDQVSANRHFVTAHATSGVLEHAFDTQLSTYRQDIGGQVANLVAPSSPISVPASIRNAITAVLGLDDSDKTLRPQHTTAAAATTQHCARWWGEQNNTDVPQRYPDGAQSNSLCGYTGASVRGMYGLGAGNTGSGTTVGIVGAYDSSTLESDIDRAAPQLGVPGLSPGQYSKVLPDGGFTDEQECGVDGWRGEQTLDVQAVHTTAPSAKLRYYAAKTCIGGLYDSFNQAVQENAVDVISASWGDADGERGLPETTKDQFNSMALQAAIQGQSVTVSTGDSGNNSGTAGSPTASFPATSPYVTAVGGTTVGLGQDGSTKVLTGWENSGNTLSGDSWVPQSDADGPFAGGAGGGASALYDEPDWQQGKVPDAVAQSHRATPDISALADSYTGFLVGRTDSTGTFGIGSYGGTSLAAPLIAGLAADAQQARADTGRGGLLNPALYAMQGSPSITDVTPQHAGVWTPSMHALPGTAVPSEEGSYLIDFDASPQNLSSGPGWDPVTGLGTPSSTFVTGLAQ